MREFEASSTATGTRRSVFCIHEDRADYLTGVKISILGLAKYAPGFEILVSSPGASADFRDWLKGQPQARLVDLPDLGAQGWNVKASVLLRLLETHEEVVWMDSDILVMNTVQGLIGHPDSTLLIATEETYWGQAQGGSVRTRAWGLQPGRVLRSTVNSGILRVTRAHVPLLQAWKTMMAHPRYLAAQAGPWYERPLHMIGDQEVLTALLGATQFADTPVKLLRRGADIAQCFGPAGFTPLERIRSLFAGGPAVVHALGAKPGRRPATPPSLRHAGMPVGRALRAYYDHVALEVSPYTIAAMAHASDLGEETGWLQARTLPARLLRAKSPGHVHLSGLPLAAFDHLIKFLRSRLGLSRFSQDERFSLSEPPI